MGVIPPLLRRHSLIRRVTRYLSSVRSVLRKSPIVREITKAPRTYSAFRTYERWKRVRCLGYFLVQFGFFVERSARSTSNSPLVEWAKHSRHWTIRVSRSVFSLRTLDELRVREMRILNVAAGLFFIFWKIFNNINCRIIECNLEYRECLTF